MDYNGRTGEYGKSRGTPGPAFFHIPESENRRQNITNSATACNSDLNTARSVEAPICGFSLAFPIQPR